MEIPVKITPDSITDSIVEVRYTSSLPFEVLIGIFFNAFDETYTYTNLPVKPIPLGAIIPNGGLSLLYNKKITLQLAPGSFVFNCLENYIGWNEYFPEIKKALTIAASVGRVDKWNRVGLRYVTHYSEKDLKSCTNFSFTFGLPEIESNSTTFHSEFSYSDARVILNLMNKLPIIKQVSGQSQQVVPTSIIDIDVIKELDESDLNSLIRTIDKVHSDEKKIFFSLLKPDFLKTLNPEY